MENDNYKYWTESVSGGKPSLPMGTIPLGFFKTKRGQGKMGAYVPIAFWVENGLVICKKGHENVYKDLEEESEWAANKAITHQEYNSWFDNGGNFTGEARVRGLGDNNPPPATEKERLEQELEYQISQFEKNKSAKESFTKTFQKIACEVEKERKLQKKPYIEGGKNIDAEFNPLEARAREYQAKCEPLKPKMVVKITNYAKLYEAYTFDKRLMDFIEALAFKDLKAGESVDGAELIEE
ncbi:MAG: hypothetical protein RLZZ292_3938 [Bacteroidota bacterium]|jgi:hypothetical protein